MHGCTLRLHANHEAAACKEAQPAALYSLPLLIFGPAASP